MTVLGAKVRITDAVTVIECFANGTVTTEEAVVLQKLESSMIPQKGVLQQSNRSLKNWRKTCRAAIKAIRS